MKLLEVRPATRLFTSYLESRGYPIIDLGCLITDYGLRYARSGSFTNRIIFPVSLDGALVTWTGRAIGRAMVRYKSLSADLKKAKADDVPVALRLITDCLWNFDSLMQTKSEFLMICEGPFDALKVDFYGRKSGIRATALFGKNASEAQIQLLSVLAPRYQRCILILDEDAALDILRIQRRVAWLNIEPFILRIAKDPAELSPSQIRSLRNLR